MKANSSINRFRRFALRGLTGGVGKRYVHKHRTLPEHYRQQIKRILVIRPNGRLGNQLMITPLVQELVHLFPDAKIDLFVKGNLSSILFRNYKQVERIIKLPGKPFKQLLKYAATWMSLRGVPYDLVINVSPGSSSGRLSTKLARSKFKIYCDLPEEIREVSDHVHMAKIPVYSLRSFLQDCGLQEEVDVPGMDIGLSEEELKNGAELLHRMVGNSKKTISLYTFATGEKMFSKEWWNTFYDKLKERFGQEYNFLEVLPVENVSQIDFREKSYYSRDIREMAAVMANTEMYIGADCGIMHLAGASKIPVVGLFSTTAPETYQVYGNCSVAIDTSKVKDMDEIVGVIGNILTERSGVGCANP